MDARTSHEEARKLRESAAQKYKDAHKSEINFHLYADAGNEVHAALEEAGALKLRNDAKNLEKQAEDLERQAADLEQQAAQVDIQIKNLQSQIDTLESRRRYLLGDQT